MRAFLKSLLFGSTPRRVRILAGAGRGLRLTIDPRKNLQRRFGLAEREVEPAFARLVPKAAAFADIGASDGWYGLLARRLQPEIYVRAFEPLEECVRPALSDWKANGFPPEALDWRQMLVRPADYPLVEALAGLPTPIFLKVDIEGAEGRLLADAVDFLREKHVRWLIVETHSPALEGACKEILRDCDFDSRIIDRASWRRWLPEKRILKHNRWLVAEAVKRNSNA